MLKDQNYDIAQWWNDQSFPGKDLFKVNELGALSLCASHFLKERNIAYLSLESADVVLKNLQEKYIGLEAKIRELEVEWVATDDKMKLAEKIDHLKENMQHLNAVGDFERAVKLIKDWEHTLHELAQENYNAKLKLVELAEGLVDADNWKDASQAFREIGEKWKQTGYIDKNRNEKLYNRIETARKKFQDRKRHFQDEEGKDMINNLDLKLEITEQAEQLANSEDWKATSEIFHKLMESWKTIGKTPNKKNEELWQRFLAAKNTFFDRKKVHFNDLQQEHEKNYLLKLPLVEKAESLKESTEWGITSQAYAKIMEEWKKIGKVSFEKSEELWKRLNEASDQFFDAKRKHFDVIKQSQDLNYNLKLNLLKRAEELKNSTQWIDATTELMDLMEEWKKIGPVPKEHSNTLWDDFNKARKHFFARKDAYRDQKKQEYEQRNQARLENEKARETERTEYEKTRETERIEGEKARHQAKVDEARNKITKLRDDIKEEEEKLADFKAAILNIAPSKKAAQLKAHLETLIEETAKNLKRLKDIQAKTGGGTHEHVKEESGQVVA